ncbi:endonuclease/exonuclease/phosphatase family protein [Embleya sp. NBC_00896]|uniref:endonuclease/exonuclease/phosphatase family protein n=1 Tax=Embleya sp. NBC_00896 TaxID=2975961 RepID=UPI003865242F|nr:endonuclease/exonuclease/phosphatase family protein [Embleya sp. NBC_00896]
MPVIVIALGIVFLVDILRVWLPSLITVYGDAGATPAEQLGLFAIVWFVAAFAAVPLCRRVTGRPVAVLAGIAMVMLRLWLQFTDGGDAQLYLACVALIAALCWLVAVAHTGWPAGVGVVTGLAIATSLHTGLGTLDPMWLEAWRGWAVLGTLAVVFVGAQVWIQAPAVPEPRPVLWAALGPVLFLTGVLFGNAGVAYAAAGEPRWGIPVLVAAWALAVPVSRLRGVWVLPLGLVLLVAGVLGAGYIQASAHEGIVGLAPAGTPGWQALGALGVGLVLGDAASRPRAAVRWAPACTMVGFFVLTFLHYARYDMEIGVLARGRVLLLGVVALAVVVGTAAVRDRRASAPAEPEAAAVPARTPARNAARNPGRTVAHAGGRTGARADVPLGGRRAGRTGQRPAHRPGTRPGAKPATNRAGSRPGAPAVPRKGDKAARDVPPPPSLAERVHAPLALATVVPVLIALAAFGLRPPTGSAPKPDGAAGTLRVVTYNIRMGYGMDGRFDLDRTATTIRALKPDVLLLNEVDRAWFLNGGHDVMTLLARRLDLPYTFAPAADPQWGDAVLTRKPIRHLESIKLPSGGAPTGAQALGVVVEAEPGKRVALVATHLQDVDDEVPQVQADRAAAFAAELGADGVPVAVLGDMNAAVDSRQLGAFAARGFVDGLAGVRPVRTYPADKPTLEIDHVFVGAGLRVLGADSSSSRASDHRPVAVTLSF